MVLLKNELNFSKKNVDEITFDKQIKNDFLRLNEEVKRLSEFIKIINEGRKNEMEETTKLMKNFNNNSKKEFSKEIKTLIEENEIFYKKIEEINSRKMDKKEFFDFKSNILIQFEEKVDLSEVQNALNTCQSDISSRFVEFKEEIKGLTRSFENDILTVKYIYKLNLFNNIIHSN